VFGDDSRDEVALLRNELSLLTDKPRIFVFNGSEEQVRTRWQPPAGVIESMSHGVIGRVSNNESRITNNAPWVLLSAKLEDEVNGLSPDEKKEYLESVGLDESGLDQLIRVGYETLGLMTFLTTGEDETRAWTIPLGSTAPRAGRAIHSDFEEKFIRAEVIEWNKLLEAGSYAAAREKGWLRTEGREYVVKDGNVIEFKI
jgi:ribosome-binding ATPase YchF (GTP1/OBG family)